MKPEIVYEALCANRVIQNRRSDEGKVGQKLINYFLLLSHGCCCCFFIAFLHESETEIQNSIKNKVSKKHK